MEGKSDDEKFKFSPLPASTREQDDKAGVSSSLYYSENVLLKNLNEQIRKTNDLLELILSELKRGKKIRTRPRNVQTMVFGELSERGGGTAKEIAERMGISENSAGPALYRLWVDGKVAQERVHNVGARPASFYWIK